MCRAVLGGGMKRLDAIWEGGGGVQAASCVLFAEKKKSCARVDWLEGRSKRPKQFRSEREFVAAAPAAVSFVHQPTRSCTFSLYGPNQLSCSRFPPADKDANVGFRDDEERAGESVLACIRVVLLRAIRGRDIGCCELLCRSTLRR